MTWKCPASCGVAGAKLKCAKPAPCIWSTGSPSPVTSYQSSTPFTCALLAMVPPGLVLDGDGDTLWSGSEHIRPWALRDDAPHERAAQRALAERVRRDADVPRRHRLELVALQFNRLAGLDVAHAEVEREPVVELQQLVVAPVLSGLAAELRLLLCDERVDLALRLGRLREPERRVEPVALPVDARAVHRDEEAGVRILLGDRGDAGAVEREVRANVHLEKVDGLAALVNPGRLLPDRPAVVVALGGDHERVVVRPPLAHCSRESAGEVGVVSLEDDLPGIPGVADDHRSSARRAVHGTRPPADCSSPTSGAIGAASYRCPSTSTSPVSVSMRIREPRLAAAAASGASSMGSPRLTQLRRKIRAKLAPTTACTPHAFIACATCSRDEPIPKFWPVTTIVSSPSWSRSEGS